MSDVPKVLTKLPLQTADFAMEFGRANREPKPHSFDWPAKE
jgi:hypothetical protein